MTDRDSPEQDGATATVQTEPRHEPPGYARLGTRGENATIPVQPTCRIELTETSDGWVVHLSLARQLLEAASDSGSTDLAADDGSGEIELVITPNLVPAGAFPGAALHIELK
jgi:hypothetical protein